MYTQNSTLLRTPTSRQWKTPKQNSRQKHNGKETMEVQSNYKTKDKMVIISLHIPVITLSVNVSKSPTKRHLVAGQFKKQDSTICCLQDTCLSYKDKQAQSEVVDDDTQANGIQEKADVVILDNREFKPKTITRHKN